LLIAQTPQSQQSANCRLQISAVECDQW